MKVFQIGAAGAVGRRLSVALVARGHDVTGMHRKPEQPHEIAETGASPVQGDLVESTVDEFAAAMAGHDAVVFSAGAPGAGTEQTDLVDGEGVVKSAAAAQRAHVTRYVLVSAFPESERQGGLGDAFEHYMRVKKSADVHLVGTNLEWVIVRPGILTDEPGDGLVSAGLAVDYGRVRRDHVAAFIAAVLEEPRVRREIIELTDGTTPLQDAVAALVR